MIPSESFLLFHRGGGLWGIDSGLVARIGPGRSGEPAGGPLRVELTSGAGSAALAADRVEGVVADLTVRPLFTALRELWPEPGCGIALYAGRPVILLDPLHLPPSLVTQGEFDA